MLTAQFRQILINHELLLEFFRGAALRCMLIAALSAFHVRSPKKRLLFTRQTNQMNCNWVNSSFLPVGISFSNNPHGSCNFSSHTLRWICAGKSFNWFIQSICGFQSKVDLFLEEPHKTCFSSWLRLTSHSRLRFHGTDLAGNSVCWSTIAREEFYRTRCGCVYIIKIYLQTTCGIKPDLPSLNKYPSWWLSYRSRERERNNKKPRKCAKVSFGLTKKWNHNLKASQPANQPSGCRIIRNKLRCMTLFGLVTQQSTLAKKSKELEANFICGPSTSHLISSRMYMFFLLFKFGICVKMIIP